MSQVNPESLETGYRLVMSDPDRETEARGVDLGLKSGLSAKTARALSAELTLPVVDWRSFIADAPTVSGLLAKDGAVMTTAAPYVDELWLQEKQLRRWNVRRPGEKAAQDRLGLLETTLGSVYMGLKDVGRGLTAIHRNFVGEVQKTLRDVNLDEVPGLDDESRAMLQDFNNVNLDKLTEDILPVFDWMKTHDQDVANASPFLRFVSDVFRSLPTTGAALIGGAVGGPVGAAAAGGSIVYGQSLDSYENDPTVTVAPEERRLYALGNAVIQGALEATGTRGLLAAFKPRGARGKALKVWFEGAVKEGVTEGAQEFPDRLFLEMARGADPTDKEDLRHLLNVFMSSEFWEDARYSALVGAAAGGLVTAPGIQAQRRAFAAQEAAFAAMPAMAKLFPNTYKLILRRHVEAGNVSREVFVPSAAVEGLFQEDATSQDVLDFLDKAGIAPADYEAARASGAPLSIPFENIADVLNDERGQALRGQLDISLEQESAGASVTAEILESVRKGELSPENMPEDERALEEIREELGLDELGLDERAFIKQDVVDAIINATAGTENAYTAEQARAYADIIDAIVATFAATHGLTYRGAFNLVAPEFARGDISVEEMDALRTQAREAASSPEAMEQDFALATNRGKTKKGQAAPRMTLEERAPLLALVRGRLDGKSLKRDFPEAYRELMQAHGRGLFRNAAKGGIAIDELADEAVSRGLLPQGAGSSELVEYLKAERRELFQKGQNNPRAAFSPVTEAKGIIRFFQSADISSAGHEIGHSLRRVLELGANMDNAPDFVRQDWEAACAFVGAEPGAAWTVEQEEKFADSFMDYLQKGNAPSVGLRRSFTRLARWLTELYRRIRRLDVQVSPEMSRVFDRLLATERELAAAKQRDGLEYMSTGIEDIPAEFLGGEDAKEIAEAVARADLDAQAAIHDKLVRELREHMAEWRKQAASFADADPDQARLDELIEQGGIVLSEERKARYGAEAIAAIRGKRVGKAIFSKDGAGVDVEMAADMWGFSGPSAVDDFMAHLAEIPTKKALRQQFMQDAFKAWRNTWTSDEVILTEGAARMLELEEVALAKVAGGQFQNEENLRRKVTEEVLKLEIGQVEKALESLKTAARENSEAVRAIYRAKLKDKAAQALELKQKQRRAVAEIRERYKAKELRRKGVAQIQRMTRAKTDVIDYEWLEQMRSVANRFGLGGRRGSVRTPEHLKPLSEFLAHVQENFDTPIPVPAWLASIPARGMDWRRLTVEQFGELTDFIKWMDHQGREAKKLTTAGQELALNEALNAMMASMNSLKGKTAIADYEKKQLGWKALVSLGRKYLAGITQFEYVFKAADGFRKGVEEMEGPHVKHIVRPLYEARSAEMAMLHDAGTALDEIMKPFRDKAGIRRSKERWAMPDVPLPEDVKKRWGALPWTYERVLMVALNMGNDGNLAALKGGFGWKDADLNRITDSLTAEDWAMVQRIWDYIDSLYPRLDAAYQAVNGLPMKKVQARRVRTKFGMLRGGYFPLVFDWELSNRAAQNKETDALMNGMAALVRSVKPSDGFTKERTGGRLPPRLSLSVLTRHIQDTCHYATHAPVIHNIRKITQDKKFRNMLEDKFGEDTLAQLQTWLNNIARPQRQELTGIEEFVEWGRQMATIQALGLKLTSSMMQLTSLSASAQEIGWKPLGEGLSFIGQNRSAAYETIRALSPMMRDRAQTINADLARSMDRLNPDRRSLVWEFGGKTYETSWNDVQRAVFAPMIFCDSIVAYSTWWGAYQKALRETEGDQNAAVTYADRAVSLAQSSGNAVNLSTLQQATGYKKLLTMFMTYTMNLQNRIRFQTRGLMEGMISPAQYMEYMFNDVATSAVVGMILKALLEGGDVPDDPRDYAKEIGYYMLSGFPLLRDAQSLYEYGGDISVGNSSISRGFSAPFMAARGAYKWWTADSPKKKDAALFSFIKYMGETAGFAMGIPSRPIFQFFQGASDIVNGKTDNPFALFVKQKDEKKK